MKVGIIADTHHNEEYTEKVVRYLKEHEHVMKIYHLGDEWEDVEIAKRPGLPVVTVPGIYAKQYKDPSIPNKITEQLSGVKVMLVHDISDLTDEEVEQSDVILHAHTHSYELKLSLGKLFINPGHLKEEYHKGRIATFCVMKAGKKGIKAKLFDINFDFVAKISRYR